LLVVAALTIGLYGRSLGRSWCCDDTQILHHALSHPLWRQFVDPATWQQLVSSSLTPWLSLSYRVDHGLFGVAPTGYYVHHLAALALCAWLLMRLAQRSVGTVWAAAGALLFLAGAPVAQASHLLMVRHYVEGLAAFALALWLVLRRLDGGPAWSSVGAGLAFAVAASAKEVYLPLGLLVFVLPVGQWRQRLHAAWPLLLVMALYVPWRAWMLGDPIGGYTPAGAAAPTTGDALARTLQPFAIVPGLLFEQPRAASAALAAVALAAWLRGARSWRWPAFVAATVLALWLPLLPLTVYPGITAGSERYFFAPWAALSLGLALALGQLARGLPRAGQAVLMLLALALALSAWQLSRRSLQATTAMHREHGAVFELLIRGGPDDLLQPPAGMASWFITGALSLREAQGVTGPAPRVAADESELASVAATVRRRWRYDAASGALVDAGPMLDGHLQAWRDRLHAAALGIDMQWQGEVQTLRWQFEAPGGGRYSFLAPGVRLAVPAAQGALRVPQPLPACFRIRHDSDEGRIAYSPWLHLPMPPRGASQVRWQGSGQTAEAVLLPAACPG
jgi:hypothetical protein